MKKTKVLFDTNIIIDLLLERQPWSAPAAELVARAGLDEIEGFLGATTLTTIHYLAAKGLGQQVARQKVRSLLALFSIAPVNRLVLDAAIDSPIADFEDAVLCEAAKQSGVESIVTRNPRDYRAEKELSIFEPREFLAILG